MATFRVGTLSQSGIHLVDLDPQRESEARRYDADGDGVLKIDEATRFYRDKTGGQRPRDITEVLQLIGGQQHVLKAYSQEAYTMAWGAGDWKGNFALDGIGAGNVRTGRQKSWMYVGNEHRQVDTFHVLVDCDLIDQRFLERNVRNATLEIGPKNFPKEAGSDFGEVTSVPLDIATIDAYHSYSRGGGGSYVPERKSFAVSLDTEDLRGLMGNSDGLSFYIRFETDDGRTHYINPSGPDGKSRPFTNFEVSQHELRPDPR